MRGKDKRAAILEAAIRVLGRDGASGFSAASLAREAGTSKANIFHHFPSVDEIPQAAFELLAGQLIAMTPREADSVEDWVEGLGDAIAALVRHNRGFLNAYFVFFSKALFDPVLKERLTAGAEALLLPIVAGFSKGRSSADAEELARMVAMMIDGYALHLLLTDRDAIARRSWRRFSTLIAKKKASRKRKPATSRVFGG